MADLRNTAVDPMTGRTGVPQMTETPRSARMGLLADALMSVRDFANRLQIPQGVPLLGGEGVGSLLLGRAPEELVEMSYGNMPMRINPYAGQTASFVPEMKPGRGAQVADLLSLAGIPGGGRTAAAAMGGAAADLGGVERAMLAYHGTPHRFLAEEGAPLGRFRSEKIGSGESNQAFGYGLYFAENPKVAGTYRSELSNLYGTPTTIEGAGQKVDIPLWIADKIEKEGLDSVIDEWTKRLNEIKESIPSSSQPWIAENNAARFEQQIEAFKTIKKSGEGKVQQAGSLYTVDIPDEMVGKMLDWDKPLSEQPKAVREFFEPLVAQQKAAALEPSGPEWGDLAAPFIYDPTGAELMQMMGKQEMTVSNVLTGGTGGRASSEALRAAGIPGVRYLDRSSRAGGEGTRNIVVFPGEEQNVKILSRE